MYQAQKQILAMLLFVSGCQCVCLADDDLNPSPASPKTQTIILPMTPVLVEPDAPIPAPKPQPEFQPKVIGDIDPDEVYVVESSVELIVLQSPIGYLKIENETGPIKVRGKFCDGTGSIETREYRSPFVYFCTGEKTGTCELILIPVGTTVESEIVRQVITVAGTGPRPPPDPDDPPQPPPGPVTSFRVIFVKESGATLSAAQSAIPGAKSIREYVTAKTTPEGGLSGWREYDPDLITTNEQPTMAALWAAVKPKLLPAPCIVIEVNGVATVKPFPANAAEALETLKKAGGE